MTAAQYKGYGIGGNGAPMPVSADSRAILMGRQGMPGYGALGDYSSAFGAPPGSIIGVAPMGDDASAGQTSAAVAAGVTASHSMIWTGVIVGLSVWLATKFLDRTFFKSGGAREPHERDPQHEED